MQHEEILHIIYNTLTGKATEQEQMRLKQWLAEDERHRQWYSQLMQRSDLAKRYRAYQAADAERAWKQFEAKTSGKRRFRLRSVLRYAAVALILIAGIGIYVQRQLDNTVPPELTQDVKTAMQQTQQSGRNQAKIEQLSAETAIQTVNKIMGWADKSRPNTAFEEEESSAYGSEEIEDWLTHAQCATTYHDKEFWLTLSDGTVVHLNYNTHIIYPENFVGDSRDVILDGEAYFMVAHSDRKPFIVHTANGDIKVHGTEFMVETRSSDGYSRVSLVKGSIGVTPSGGTEQLMRPNQQATFKARASKCTLKEVDTYPYVAWNTGVFSFNDAPLELVMRVLSHWYGVEVSFADEHLKHERFYGDLDRYETLDNILSAIEKSTNIHIERVNNKLVIK